MIFNQRDPKWSGVKLGSKGLITMGAYGCTTCCIAEVNNKLGAACLPPDVANHKDWYTPEGLVLWSKLNLKNAVWKWRGYRFDKKVIVDHIKDKDKAVIIEVPLGAGKHWLTGESVNMFGRIMARDPWHGDICDVLKRYKKVTGYATFVRRDPPLK